jgi:flagellar basal body-associated protein FliL
VKKTILVALAALISLTVAACGGGAEPSPTPTLPPQILEISDVLQINIKDTERGYVTCQVSVEVETAEELEVITYKEAQICDIINTVLRAKTIDQLRAPDILETLSTELVEKIAAELELATLKDVYFKDFKTIA